MRLRATSHMVARGYLVLLVALLALGAAAARLLGGPAASLGALLIGMGGTVVAAAGVIVAASYAVSRRHASAAPPELRVGPLALAVAMLRELAAHILVFCVLVPFERLWMRTRRADGAKTSTEPVLLVHGYLCSAGAWWRFARLLERRGFRAHAAIIEPALSSLDEMVGSLARQIEALCIATASARVKLVAHSMGGLVCRAYLRRHGAARIARLVTVGTPHQGTLVARLGLGRNAREMEPGNPWLVALADSESRARMPPTVSFFSYHDNYVAPQEASRLPWASNVPLAGLGHVEMYLSTRVAALVADALGDDGVDPASGPR